MYCTTCEKVAPDEAVFCSTCGSKLVPVEALNPQEAYYVKLVHGLSERGFRMDPRLATDTGLGFAKVMMKLAIGFNFDFEGIPGVANMVDAFSEPFTSVFMKVAAFSGERIYQQFATVANRFEVLAATHFMMSLHVFGAVNADDLTLAQAQSVSEALVDALAGLYDTRDTRLGKVPTSLTAMRNAPNAYCAFVFFDPARAKALADQIIKKCMQKRLGLFTGAQAVVMPIVINVPERDIMTMRGGKISLRVGDAMGPLGLSTLNKAFPLREQAD